MFSNKKMSKYSLIDSLRNGIDFILTKIFFPKARLVRRPIYIRGKCGIEYENGFTTGHGCRIDASSRKKTLTIGKNARIGDYVHINANDSVVIGNNVLIASKVFISDATHGMYSGENQTSPYTNPSEREIFTSSVSIGDNVWIGENVVILPGSKIGDGCIIGANAVVNGKEFHKNCIIGGIPAKVIKIYNEETQKWEKCNNE